MHFPLLKTTQGHPFTYFCKAVSTKFGFFASFKAKIASWVISQTIFASWANMVVPVHAICFIFTELSTPNWQKEVKQITYEVVEAMKETKKKCNGSKLT